MSPKKNLIYFYATIALILMPNLLVIWLRYGSITKYGEPHAPREAGLNQKSYMLTLRIPEQLTMSTIHFHQFLNLVNDWNFTGVEPFAYQSTLYGLRSLHERNPYGSVPFNTLFNTTQHNSYMSDCMKRKQTPETPLLFETSQEFLHYSYRKLVLVYFAGRTDAQKTLTNGVHFKMENAIAHESNLFSDCSFAAQASGMFERIETLLSKEIELERSHPTNQKLLTLHRNLKGFKVVQSFCVKRNILMSLRDLKSFVFDHIQQNIKANDSYDHGVSIIFPSWQGRFTRPFVDSDVKNYINNCRLPFSRPFHSNYVVDLAQKYLESQLSYPGKPYLSVHIRFEKLLHYVKNYKVDKNKYLDCCMMRVNKLIDLVSSNFSIDKGNVLINWDYSPYGSVSCLNLIFKSECRDVALEHIKKLKIKPSYFDPKPLGIPPYLSLISLVEMHALNRGSALVTVGEGSYQETITESFIEQHRFQDNNIKAAENLYYGHLCIPPEQLHELSETSDLGEPCHLH